jgi:hypothetical protein
MKNSIFNLFLLLLFLGLGNAIAQVNPNLKTRDLKITKVQETTPITVKQDTVPKYTQLKKINSVDLKRFQKITPVVTTETTETTTTTTDTDRTGLNISSYEDIEVLLNQPQYDGLFEKLNIFRNIYADKNKNSNYYYYLPSTYTLKWTKENGKYDFNIFYLSSESGSKSSVLIKAELVSNIKSEDLQLLEKILTLNKRKSIKLMPLDVVSVSIDFGATLTNFNVKPESVSIMATSDFLKPIIVNWKMESNVDDFVSAMMNNIGINASIDFIPAGVEDRIISVPVNLQVNDPITFGKLEIKQMSELRSGWNNYLDYPVVLSKLVLVRNNPNGSTIESYPLSNEEIQPKSNFILTDASILNRVETGNQIGSAWFEYAITECATCNETVRKKIVGGTSGSQVTNLEIQILNIMEKSGAYMFKLNLKSLQADPNGATEVQLPSITIKTDDQSFNGGKFYIPEGETLLYQYQFIKIMPDGATTTGPWKKSDQSFLVIGEKQLETAFEPDAADWKSGLDTLIDKGIDAIEDLLKKDKDPENKEENKTDGGNK